MKHFYPFFFFIALILIYRGCGTLKINYDYNRIAKKWCICNNEMAKITKESTAIFEEAKSNSFLDEALNDLENTTDSTLGEELKASEEIENTIIESLFEFKSFHDKLVELSMTYKNEKEFRKMAEKEAKAFLDNEIFTEGELKDIWASELKEKMANLTKNQIEAYLCMSRINYDTFVIRNFPHDKRNSLINAIRKKCPEAIPPF